MPRFLIILCVVFIVVGCARKAPPADSVTYNFLKNGSSSIGVIQVYEGDNLYAISKRYKISMRDLIEKNNLSAPFLIKTGDRLSIPSPRIHKARAGDSYSIIAQLYDLSVTDLTRLNDASAPYRLSIGQDVYLSRSKTHIAQGAKQTVSSGSRPSPKPISKQVQQAKKAVVKNVAPPKLAGRFSYPVQGRLISGYGPKKGGLFNDGINIAAPRGTITRAAENGSVAYVGNDLKGFGNLVLVKHQNGLISAYAHLDKILVQKGATIARGDTLGTVGSTGSVSTPQLHFEIRKNGRPIDPAGYLG